MCNTTVSVLFKNYDKARQGATTTDKSVLSGQQPALYSRKWLQSFPLHLPFLILHLLLTDELLFPATDIRPHLCEMQIQTHFAVPTRLAFYAFLCLTTHLQVFYKLLFMTRKVIKYHKSHQIYLLASIKVEIERNNHIPIIIISTMSLQP